MKKFIKVAILTVLCFFGSLTVKAQTSTPSYCTLTTPCIDLTWTNGNDIAATETTANGIETAGPATINILRCTNSSTQGCYVNSGILAVPSAWTPVSVTNGQSLLETSNTGGPFYDTTVSYGNTYTYTASLTWNAGGLPSVYAVPAQVPLIGIAGTITSPSPNSVLTSVATTFTWTTGAGVGGVTGYYLHVGTTPGGYDLVNIGPLSGTSTTVNIPANGATIYVQLYTVLSNGTQLSNNNGYTYTEVTGPPTVPLNINAAHVP